MSEPPPDFSSFVQELTACQADLRGFVVGMMPGHPDIDDVVQKTNIVLWNKREVFEPGTNFRAWALTIARFEVLNHLRSRRRSKCFTFDEEVLERLAEDSARETAASGDRLAALEHCLGMLRERDRELLDHRYRRQGGLEQFARQTGRSISGLSVTLFRLRAALRRCVLLELEKKGGCA